MRHFAGKFPTGLLTKSIHDPSGSTLWLSEPCRTKMNINNNNDHDQFNDGKNRPMNLLGSGDPVDQTSGILTYHEFVGFCDLWWLELELQGYSAPPEQSWSISAEVWAQPTGGLWSENFQQTKSAPACGKRCTTSQRKAAFSLLSCRLTIFSEDIVALTKKRSISGKFVSLRNWDGTFETR